MAQVFVSYARPDRDRVAHLAHALERSGMTVWWDRHIPPGSTFDEVLEQELESASAVVAVWTTTSVESRWVRTEAAEGLHRGVLVPVLLDPVTPPLEFRRIQSVDLTHWVLGSADDALTDFIRTVLALSDSEAGTGRGFADDPRHRPAPVARSGADPPTGRPPQQPTSGPVTPYADLTKSEQRRIQRRTKKGHPPRTMQEAAAMLEYIHLWEREIRINNTIFTVAAIVLFASGFIGEADPPWGPAVMALLWVVFVMWLNRHLNRRIERVVDVARSMLSSA